MKVENNKVVRFHYSLSEGGLAIESSRDGEPLTLLFGQGGLIKGVEEALAGRDAGERIAVTVPPERGYGERNESLTQRVSKKFFRDADKLKPGMLATVSTANGPRTVTILKVGQSVVDVDGNHPMAGRTLDFDLEIVDVRDATEEELAHGHAHGPGGHHHH